MAILLLFLYHDKAGGSNGDAHIASSVERLRLGIGGGVDIWGDEMS